MQGQLTPLESDPRSDIPHLPRGWAASEYFSPEAEFPMRAIHAPICRLNPAASLTNPSKSSKNDFSKPLRVIQYPVSNGFGRAIRGRGEKFQVGFCSEASDSPKTDADFSGQSETFHQTSRIPEQPVLQLFSRNNCWSLGDLR